MKIVKLLLFSVALFSLGFLANAFLLQKNAADITALSQQSVLGEKAEDRFITNIDYDGEKFKPSSVTVKKGNYIAITNTSRDQLMWLISDHQDLQTARGYGEGEKLQLILLKEGTYKVTNRLDTKGLLGVVVEP